MGYDKTLKIQVLQEVEESGKNFTAVAKKHNIEPKTVESWYDNRDVILGSGLAVMEKQKDEFITKTWDTAIQTIEHLKTKIESANIKDSINIIDSLISRIKDLVTLDTLTQTEMLELEQYGSDEDLSKLQKGISSKIKVLKQIKSKSEKKK